MIFDYYEVFRNEKKSFDALRLIFENFIDGHIFSVTDITEKAGITNINVIKTLVVLFSKQGALDRIPGEWRYIVKNISIITKIFYEVEILFRYFDERKEKGISEYRMILNLPTAKHKKMFYGRVSTKLGDLYGAILDLIREAKKEVIILNPFFDDLGIAMISNVLANRIEQHVSVKIITRYFGIGNETNRTVIEKLRSFLKNNQRTNDENLFKVFNYLYKDGNDVLHNFHAKAIIIDEGYKAYIGSANLTGRSLEELFEIGIINQDQNSILLWEIVSKYLYEEGYLQEITV